MGMDDNAGGQLAPTYVDVAHAGLPAFRCAAWVAPSSERITPRGEHGAALCGSSSHDRRGLAQRIGSGIVRDASIARRIRGVDLRAERLVEHVLWTGS